MTDFPVWKAYLTAIQPLKQKTMTRAIPAQAKIGKFTIIVTPEIDMVSVQEPGLLVPKSVKIFNAPQDGTLRECYDKAVTFTSSLVKIKDGDLKVVEGLIVHEESLSNKVEGT